MSNAKKKEWEEKSGIKVGQVGLGAATISLGAIKPYPNEYIEEQVDIVPNISKLQVKSIEIEQFLPELEEDMDL